MTSMHEPVQNNSRINDTIVEAAITALAPFHPESREDAANMLLFWMRRSEMTDLDLVEVQQRMFPAGPPTDSAVYRDGYAEGFLDAIQLQTGVSPEVRKLVSAAMARREDLTDAHREEIRLALRMPAERLIDETAERWAQEHDENVAKWARMREEFSGRCELESPAEG